MDKTSNPIEISTENLFQLILKKQYAQYKNYVSEVQLQNDRAQQAVVSNLKTILVDKKHQEPSICFNALVFYKTLLVGASMDFLCEEALFPQEIHKQLYNICVYKGTQKNMEKRASHYFSELFNINYNQQNGKFSYNYVLLALQLLKSMAQWYPQNYNDKKKVSIFKQMYDKLQSQNIYFPQTQHFSLIKPADKQKFTTNYNKFKSYFQQAQLEIQKAQTPGFTPDKKDVQMKLTSSIRFDKEQQKDPELPLLKGPLKTNQKTIRQENDPAMIQFTDSFNKKGNSLNLGTSIKEQEDLKGFILQSQILNKGSSALLDANINKPIIKKQVQISPQPQTQKFRVEQLQYKESSVKREIIIHKNNPRTEENISKLKQQINKKTENIIEKSQILQQLRTPKQEKHQNLNNNNQRNKTPKNLQHTEKRKISSPSSHQQSKRLQPAGKQYSHKSLPKTEKRKISVKQEKEKSFQTWTNLGSIQNQTFKNTLSHLSSLRKQIASKELDQYCQITNSLQQMRFDNKRVNFNLQYFKPLPLSMVSLRYQALNMSCFPNPFNQFYSGPSIQGRLIKEGGKLYTLSLRNISQDALSVGFKDMSSQRFSDRIKILSWGNRTNFKPYSTTSLLKNSHLDIKFTVKICDYSLKFMTFDLFMNGQQCFLVLPITLLDMTQPKSSIQSLSLDEFRLKGTIICSNSFQLRRQGLPNFFGNFYFKEFTSTKMTEWQGKVVGGCRLAIPIESYARDEKRQIIILVRVANYSKRLVQLVIIFTKRDSQSQKYSLAYLQLLQFLLMQE